MATRPIYHSLNQAPFYERIDTDFVYCCGFAVSQKQKSISNLHGAYKCKYPERKILEISTKSQNLLGVNLSAFNLEFTYQGQKLSVETAFQGSKVFEKGVSVTDLYAATSYEAKKDERIRTSGKLEKFVLFDEVFPLEPKDFFYNWIYINALYRNPGLAHDAMEYDSFSDIEFNPQKSINCQAIAVAMFVGLSKAGKIDEAIKSKENFLDIVYGNRGANEQGIQMSLFDLM